MQRETGNLRARALGAEEIGTHIKECTSAWIYKVSTILNASIRKPAPGRVHGSLANQPASQRHQVPASMGKSVSEQ